MSNVRQSEDQNGAGRHRPWPMWIALIGFLAVGGFFLLTEHRAHVFGALPYLLVLACLLMHLFMHRGHGGHGHGRGNASQDPSGPTRDADHTGRST